VSPLPDWYRRMFFSGQNQGLWDILAWASRLGYYRGIVLYGAIVQGSDWYQDVITIPSGKTFYLVLFVIGSRDDTAVYWVDLKDNAGAHYFEDNVKQGVVVPYPVPIPIPGGRTLYLYTHGYNVTTDYYATIIGFLY